MASPINLTEATKNAKVYKNFPSLKFVVNTGYLPKALMFNRKVIPKNETTSRLEYSLDTLQRIAENNNYICLVYQDFVKHSFYFCFYNQNGYRTLNGGVILHGFQETFSVELNPKSFPHYSIHT
jgi:hypothetical protein